jgi:thiol-disulfide isomerase/thioredoxin
MKTKPLIIFLSVCSLGLSGLTTAARAAETSDKKVVVKELLGEHEDEASLQKAIDKATKAGVSRGTIVEARMRYHLGQKDLDALYKMRGDLKTIVDEWQSDASAFDTKEEAETFVAFVTAMAADSAKDDKLFKESIVRAFWLSPSNADTFGKAVIDHKRDPSADKIIDAAMQASKGDDPAKFEAAVKEAFWIAPDKADKLGELAADFQKRQKIKDLTVPLDTELLVSDGSSVTLKTLLGKRRALYLDFWASWCGPCRARMKTLEARGKALRDAGIVVAGVNTEHDLALAEKMRKEKHMTVAWLVEPKTQPLQKVLDVEAIPKVWLIDASGKLLYEGHPDDDDLRQVLKSKFDVTLPPNQNEG